MSVAGLDLTSDGGEEEVTEIRLSPTLWLVKY